MLPNRPRSQNQPHTMPQSPPRLKLYPIPRFTCSQPCKGRERNRMGDFVQKSITKTAVRELAAPIESITAFNTIVAAVLSGNPWGCTAYEIAGVAQSPVAKSREGYTARIEFVNRIHAAASEGRPGGGSMTKSDPSEGQVISFRPQETARRLKLFLQY